ncbi:MAG: ATP-binding protein, partial [Gemmatimonadetes bacterium]|nr:ATP-binding protein [Gemmatimonadota bacterium]
MSPIHDHALTFDSDPFSVTNFVDRMHSECMLRQWLRELVVNSIEAIDATDEGGNIFVHSIEQDMGEELGKVRKLAVTDTGEGIAEDQLYSSFQVAMTSRGKGNYGIGAKIAALPMNPAGLIYRSLVDGGRPSELMWYRTSRYGGHYAAYGWPEAGQVRYVTSLSCDDSEFSRIAEAGHGTQVVLCGEGPEDDTCRTLSPTPSNAKTAGNLHWVIRELNFKFWKIPENIEIRVENAKRSNDESGARDFIVHGGEKGLASIVANKGVVDLVDQPYKVKWFLLDEAKAKRANAHMGWASGRIVGTLYRESTGVVEVYAVRRKHRGAALMNDFGIYTGADRVVLLIEPTHQDIMQPTTARDDLRVGEEGTVADAYKEIGQEFAGLMAEKAPALASYVKKQLEGLKSTPDVEELKNVIAHAIELYQIKDYRRLAKGRIRTSATGEERQAVERTQIDQDDPDAEVDDPPPPDPIPTPHPRPRPQPRPRPRPRSIEDAAGGDRSNQVPPVPDPKEFKWGRGRGCGVGIGSG